MEDRRKTPWLGRFENPCECEKYEAYNLYSDMDFQLQAVECIEDMAYMLSLALEGAQGTDKGYANAAWGLSLFTGYVRKEIEAYVDEAQHRDWLIRDAEKKAAEKRKEEMVENITMITAKLNQAEQDDLMLYMEFMLDTDKGSRGESQDEMLSAFETWKTSRATTDRLDVLRANAAPNLVGDIPPLADR